MKHYRNVVKLDPCFFDYVDWESIQLALNDYDKISQSLKALHSQWNTMPTCKLWKRANSDMCPLCDSEPETWQHVLRCKNEHIVRTRNESLLTMKRTLSQMKTNEMLSYHIMWILRTWSDGNVLDAPKQSPFFPSAEIHKAYIHQSDIGFDLFMKGMVSTQWAEIQEFDYSMQDLPRKYNIVRWRKNIVRSLLEHCCLIWNERCTIVQALNNNTHETRMRAAAWEYCLQIKSEPWRIPHIGRHLLERDKRYFHTTRYVNVTEWNHSINTAIARGSGQMQKFRDIRDFFNRDESNESVLRQTATTIRDRVVSTCAKIQSTLKTFLRS